MTEGEKEDEGMKANGEKYNLSGKKLSQDEIDDIVAKYLNKG